MPQEDAAQQKDARGQNGERHRAAGGPFLQILDEHDQISAQQQDVADGIDERLRDAAEAEFPHEERQPHQYDARVTPDLFKNAHDLVAAKVFLFPVADGVNDIGYQHHSDDRRAEQIYQAEFHISSVSGPPPERAG